MAYLDEKSRGVPTAFFLALETQRSLLACPLMKQSSLGKTQKEKKLVSEFEFDWHVQGKCYREECMIALVYFSVLLWLRRDWTEQRVTQSSQMQQLKEKQLSDRDVYTNNEQIKSCFLSQSIRCVSVFNLSSTQ